MLAQLAKNPLSCDGGRQPISTASTGTIASGEFDEATARLSLAGLSREEVVDIAVSLMKELHRHSPTASRLPRFPACIDTANHLEVLQQQPPPSAADAGTETHVVLYPASPLIELETSQHLRDLGAFDSPLCCSDVRLDAIITGESRRLSSSSTALDDGRTVKVTIDRVIDRSCAISIFRGNFEEQRCDEALAGSGSGVDSCSHDGSPWSDRCRTLMDAIIAIVPSRCTGPNTDVTTIADDWVHAELESNGSLSLPNAVISLVDGACFIFTMQLGERSISEIVADKSLAASARHSKKCVGALARSAATALRELHERDLAHGGLSPALVAMTQGPVGWGARVLVVPPGLMLAADGQPPTAADDAFDFGAALHYFLFGAAPDVRADGSVVFPVESITAPRLRRWRGLLSGLLAADPHERLLPSDVLGAALKTILVTPLVQPALPSIHTTTSSNASASGSTSDFSGFSLQW